MVVHIPKCVCSERANSFGSSFSETSPWVLINTPTMTAFQSMREYTLYLGPKDHMNIDGVVSRRQPSRCQTLVEWEYIFKKVTVKNGSIALLAVSQEALDQT